MRNLKKLLVCIFLAFCMTIMVSVDLPALHVVSTVEAASKVKINKTKATVVKGKTLQLKISGTSKKVTWSSSKKTVATVSSKGKVTGKKAGTATITAKAGGKKYTCKVTVKEPTPKISKTSLSLKVGQTATLKMTGATKKVTWSSSKKSVATVSSKGKITAKKAGTATITAKTNGVVAKCKITVKSKSGTSSSSVPTVNFKSLRGKSYSYKNSKYSFGIGFAKSSDYAYLGVWNVSGKSSSYEDFAFPIKEGTYRYSLKGMRSSYIYDITIKPYKDYIKISLKCRNSSYSYFNISNRNFKKTTNTTCSAYAESSSVVEIKDYLYGAGGLNTVRYTQQLANAIGGMKAGRNAKYPDLYFAGNNMVIGVNNNPTFDTLNDEYVRIENNGNAAVLFYGVKIGDTRSKMESKFAQYNIRTWDNGKTYSNANGWEIKVTFQDGKLKSYIYLCKPTI